MQARKLFVFFLIALLPVGLATAASSALTPSCMISISAGGTQSAPAGDAFASGWSPGGMMIASGPTGLAAGRFASWQPAVQDW